MGTLITILLAVGLAAYAAWAVRRLRQKGTSCCGGSGCSGCSSCSGCAMAGQCHCKEKAK